MNHRPAFTILELLISITLSSFIMLGMIQLYQGVVRYVEATRDMMATNRKLCLLFNQLERDFSSAYIPTLAKEERVAPEGKTPETPAPAQTPEEKKKEEELEKEQRKLFFIAIIDEQADLAKIDGRRVEQCKSLSFICTNPLQVYGEKKIRLVRVIYELVRDKEKSTRDQSSYKLVRKETYDLLNARGKVDDFAPVQAGKSVQSYVVAEDIKGFFLEYVMKKEEKKDDKGTSRSADQKKEYQSFKWGDKKETQAVVPEKILVWVDCWDSKKIKSTMLHTLFPVMSYPTPTQKEDEKDKNHDKNQKHPDKQPAPSAPGQQAQEAQTTAGASPQQPAPGAA